MLADLSEAYQVAQTHHNNLLFEGNLSFELMRQRQEGAHINRTLTAIGSALMDFASVLDFLRGMSDLSKESLLEQSDAIYEYFKDVESVFGTLATELGYLEKFEGAVSAYQPGLLSYLQSAGLVQPGETFESFKAKVNDIKSWTSDLVAYFKDLRDLREAQRIVDLQEIKKLKEGLTNSILGTVGDVLKEVSDATYANIQTQLMEAQSALVASSLATDASFKEMLRMQIRLAATRSLLNETRAASQSVESCMERQCGLSTVILPRITMPESADGWGRRLIFLNGLLRTLTPRVNPFDVRDRQCSNDTEWNTMVSEALCPECRAQRDRVERLEDALMRLRSQHPMPSEKPAHFARIDDVTRRLEQARFELAFCNQTHCNDGLGELGPRFGFIMPAGTDYLTRGVYGVPNACSPCEAIANLLRQALYSRDDVERVLRDLDSRESRLPGLRQALRETSSREEILRAEFQAKVANLAGAGDVIDWAATRLHNEDKIDLVKAESVLADLAAEIGRLTREIEQIEAALVERPALERTRATLSDRIVFFRRQLEDCQRRHCSAGLTKEDFAAIAELPIASGVETGGAPGSAPSLASRDQGSVIVMGADGKPVEGKAIWIPADRKQDQSDPIPLVDGELRDDLDFTLTQDGRLIVDPVCHLRVTLPTGSGTALGSGEAITVKSPRKPLRAVAACGADPSFVFDSIARHYGVSIAGEAGQTTEIVIGKETHWLSGSARQTHSRPDSWLDRDYGWVIGDPGCARGESQAFECNHQPIESGEYARSAPAPLGSCDCVPSRGGYRWQPEFVGYGGEFGLYCSCQGAIDNADGLKGEIDRSSQDVSEYGFWPVHGTRAPIVDEQCEYALYNYEAIHGATAPAMCTGVPQPDPIECLDSSCSQWIEFEQPIFPKRDITDPLARSKGAWGQDYDDQWWLAAIGAVDDRGRSVFPTAGKEIVVAVLDSGLDIEHPEIVDRIWRSSGEIPSNAIDDDDNGFIDDVNGWNFVDGTANVHDDFGHGTAVSGIIAAVSGNGIGIAGLNPWARLLPVKIGGYDGRASNIDLAMGIRYAVDQGAKVINVSYGGSGHSRIVEAAADHARAAGALTVVASGNEGIDARDTFPASIGSVLSVGGVGIDGERLPFSNWGDAVALVAPASDILTLRAAGTDLLRFDRSDYVRGQAVVEDLYYRVTGTSFAAPQVSGLASLLLSTRDDLDLEALIAVLLGSAVDTGFPGVDQHTGAGLINLSRALETPSDFRLVARIDGVAVVRKGTAYVVQVNGEASANQFRQAMLELGEGESPSRWETVLQHSEEMRQGVIAEIDASQLQGATTWTLKLTVQHADGTVREVRFLLELGV